MKARLCLAHLPRLYLGFHFLRICLVFAHNHKLPFDDSNSHRGFCLYLGSLYIIEVLSVTYMLLSAQKTCLFIPSFPVSYFHVDPHFLFFHVTGMYPRLGMPAGNTSLRITPDTSLPRASFRVRSTYRYRENYGRRFPHSGNH